MLIGIGLGVGYLTQQSSINSDSSQIATLKHQNARLTSKINSLGAELKAEVAATNLVKAQLQQQQQAAAAAYAAAAAAKQQTAAQTTTPTTACTESPSVCQALQYQADHPNAPPGNTG
jgi:hypothetical protein